MLFAFSGYNIDIVGIGFNIYIKQPVKIYGFFLNGKKYVGNVHSSFFMALIYGGSAFRMGYDKPSVRFKDSMQLFSKGFFIGKMGICSVYKCDVKAVFFYIHKVPRL